MHLKEEKGGNIDKDIHKMCTTLMREMLWDQKPKCIDMYTIKKHFKYVPELKDKQITSLKPSAFEQLQEHDCIVHIKDKKPISEVKIPMDNEI